MPDLEELKNELEQKRQEQLAKQRTLTELRGRLRQLNLRVEQLRRSGVHDPEHSRSLEEQRTFQLHRQTETQILAIESELKSTREIIHKLIQDIVTFETESLEVSSSKAIAQLSNSTPFLLFPVRKSLLITGYELPHVVKFFTIRNAHTLLIGGCFKK